ncbi:MFS transporter [Amycolatopsis acidiphila]|uniref:MFS transporter n=1 Tax=Amycolatopsis acidiphila TaxID=715473 RepID=UPI001643B128|nr:MFS transporter [Amycolatopsis acidiphila]UIJ56529.1 MFS transporter [Amycolatopsis acidiphila]
MTLALLSLPVFAVAVDSSSLVIVLPTLSADLGASSTEQLWIADIYVFMLAGFLVAMGAFGDWVGQRKLLLVGAAVFSGTSFFAAFAQSVLMLIIARAVMGLAGSVIMALSLGLIGTTFSDRRRRGVGIATRTCAMLAGAAAGPPLGGFVAEQFWWGAVFLLNVPIMATLLIAGRFLLSDKRVAGASKPDLVSAVLAVSSVLIAVYGIKEFARYGPGAPPAVAILAGVAGAVVFFLRQRGCADPLFDFGILRDRSVTVVSAAMLLGGLVLGGAAFFVPLFVQMVRGFSPAESGLSLIPNVLLTIVASIMAARLIVRYSATTLLLIALICAMSGCFAFCLARNPGSLLLVYAGYALISLGVTPVMVLGTNLIMGAVPAAKTGMAASIVTTNGNLGGALGLALLGAAGSAAYRSGLAVPASVPADAVAAARDGISGAVVSAQRLPPKDAEALLDSAHLSFMKAINVVGLAGIALCAVCAVLVVTVFAADQRRKMASP